MNDYYEQPTKIGGSMSDGISPGRGKVRLRLAQDDASEGLILTNVHFFPNSPSSLVSLALLNDSSILHDNENKTFYDRHTITNHRKLPTITPT